MLYWLIWILLLPEVNSWTFKKKIQFLQARTATNASCSWRWGNLPLSKLFTLPGRNCFWKLKRLSKPHRASETPGTAGWCLRGKRAVRKGPLQNNQLWWLERNQQVHRSCCLPPLFLPTNDCRLLFQGCALIQQVPCLLLCANTTCNASGWSSSILHTLRECLPFPRKML